MFESWQNLTVIHKFDCFVVYGYNFGKSGILDEWKTMKQTSENLWQRNVFLYLTNLVLLEFCQFATVLRGFTDIFFFLLKHFMMLVANWNSNMKCWNNLKSLSIFLYRSQQTRYLWFCREIASDKRRCTVFKRCCHIFLGVVWGITWKLSKRRN